MTPALALVAALEAARVVSVHTHAVDGRPAVRIVAVGDLAGVTVRREAFEVVISLDAEAPDIPAPPGLAPLTSIHLERDPPGMRVRIQVPPEVPFEVRREPGVLEVVFGEASALPPPPGPDVKDLYQRLFPSPVGEEAGGQVVGAGTEGTTQDDSGGRLRLGNATFRPSMAASYVDARSVVLDTPTPTSDGYFQVQPRLAAEMPLRNGSLKAAYEARLRRGASFAPLETTSHLLDASLQLPVGSRLTLRGGDRYTKGLLETTEVDPGKEYFFGLGRFHRNQAEAGARIEAGARLLLDVGLTDNRVRFDEQAGFFDYDTREARAELSYELTPDLRTGLAYARERTPPSPARPESETRSQSALLTLRGELGPLTTVQLAAGFEDLKSPQAAEGGTSYRGASASLALNRQFSRAADATLSVSRASQLSAFEENAFYVSSDIQGQANLPVPFSCSLALGAGYHWNDYRTVAAGLGEPRQDRIFGWVVGIGRPITRHAYLRIDYRKERRDSNLDAFDTRSEALIIQLGFGLFGTGRP